MFCAIFGTISGFFYSGMYRNARFGYLCDILQIGCWHCGQLFCYLYLLNRLYIGLKNTIYNISIKKLTLLGILLFMYFLFFCSIVFPSIMYIIHNDYSGITVSKLHSRIMIIYKIGTLLIDLILSTSLLIIFIKKLYQVSNRFRIESTTNLNVWNNDIDDVKSEVENLEKDRIYNIISKVTILSNILILVSQLVMIFSVISWVLIIYSKILNTNNLIMVAIYNSFKAIHIFIASFCIFLGFECTSNWYQFCCIKCHIKTKEYCIKQINMSYTIQ